MSTFDPSQPDDRDLDEGGLDLSPREVALGKSRSAGRRWAPLAVLAVLALVLVFIVIQAQGASLYFRNADEAVAQKAELGDKKFRIQGTVVTEPKEEGSTTTFTVAHNGVSVDIVHTGSEPAMFDDGIPVVAEGRWSADGKVFESDRLLVKHDEDYKDYDEKNPDRVKPEQKTTT